MWQITGPRLTRCRLLETLYLGEREAGRDVESMLWMADEDTVISVLITVLVFVFFRFRVKSRDHSTRSLARWLWILRALTRSIHTWARHYADFVPESSQGEATVTSRQVHGCRELQSSDTWYINRSLNFYTCASCVINSDELKLDDPVKHMGFL